MPPLKNVLPQHAVAQTRKRCWRCDDVRCRCDRGVAGAASSYNKTMAAEAPTVVIGSDIEEKAAVKRPRLTRRQIIRLQKMNPWRWICC